MAAMLPWNSDNSQRTIHSILELYQRCRRNGDWAKIYIETQDGKEFFSFSVSPSAGSSAGGAGVEKVKSVRKKNPSQVRRDQKRRAAFLERFRQKAEPTAAETTSTPSLETDEFKVGEEKTVTGETSSAEATDNETSDSTGKNEVIMEEVAEESRLTEENIEQLRKIIHEAYNENRIFKKDFLEEKGEDIKDENDSKDENDNIEEAKLWAIGQKQSFIKSEK